jgi:hypothetical protein
MIAAGAVLASMQIIRSRIPGLGSHLSYPVVGISCGVIVPLCIILYFAAGKATVLPLPAGVNVMNNFGCCS